MLWVGFVPAQGQGRGMRQDGAGEGDGGSWRGREDAGEQVPVGDGGATVADGGGVGGVSGDLEGFILSSEKFIFGG